MPDTFDTSFAHFAVQDSPVIDRRRDAMDAALSELRSAVAQLLWALDCDRYLAASDCVSKASVSLENAATLCPERSAELLTLAGRLDDSLDCIGWPDMAAALAVMGEAGVILRAMTEGG